jgi:2-methylisocitrate lyase-like PEP mutase family enzyme
MSAAAAFRDLMDRDEIVVRPAAHDAFTAKIIEQVGFETLALSGFGTSLSMLGRPDAGYVTLTEKLWWTRNVSNAVDVPIVADFDTGFGNALKVRRTVEEVITTTQLAGIMLEDQVEPKRCGHIGGKQIITREEAVGKIQAAVDVREELGDDLVLMARTDALGAAGGGFDEAITRANRFAEIGADIVFVEGPTSVEEVQRIGREVDAPLVYPNMVGERAVSPLVEHEKLEHWGYDVVSYLASPVPTMVAVYDYLSGLQSKGAQQEIDYQWETADHPVNDLFEFAGFDEVRELEERYLPEEVNERYAQSIGYDPEGDDE